MIVTVKSKGNNINLHYRNGILSFVMCDSLPVTVQMSITGSGYSISHEGGILPMNVCDARYVYIPKFGIHVPRLLVIEE